MFGASRQIVRALATRRAVQATTQNITARATAHHRWSTPFHTLSLRRYSTTHQQDGKYLVGTFYQFCTFNDYEKWVGRYRDVCLKNDILGTVHLSPEGINGTVSGSEEGIKQLFDWVKQDERFQKLFVQTSWSPAKPFGKMKIKVRQELISLGVRGINPSKGTGTHVDSEAWDKLLAEPDVVVLDTRNIYEYTVGTFDRAINPNIEHFNTFPDYVAKNLDKEKHKRVAMFCTGGIRCEKASAYMLGQGFENVYQLQGGMINYMRERGGKESKFAGDCFVFDERFAVNHALAEAYAETMQGLEALLPKCNVRKMVRNEPGLLEMEVETETKKHYAALAKVFPRPNVNYMVERMPSLLLSDQSENVKQWMRSVSTGVGKGCDPAHLLKQEPELLTQKPDEICKKLLYLHRIFPLETANHLAHGFPALLRKDMSEIRALESFPTNGSKVLSLTRVSDFFRDLVKKRESREQVAHA